MDSLDLFAQFDYWANLSQFNIQQTEHILDWLLQRGLVEKHYEQSLQRLSSQEQTSYLRNMDKDSPMHFLFKILQRQTIVRKEQAAFLYNSVYAESGNLREMLSRNSKFVKSTQDDIRRLQKEVQQNFSQVEAVQSSLLAFSQQFQQAGILHQYFSINPKCAIDKRIKHQTKFKTICSHKREEQVQYQQMALLYNKNLDEINETLSQGVETMQKMDEQRFQSLKNIVNKENMNEIMKVKSIQCEIMQLIEILEELNQISTTNSTVTTFNSSSSSLSPTSSSPSINFQQNINLNPNQPRKKSSLASKSDSSNSNGIINLNQPLSLFPYKSFLFPMAQKCALHHQLIAPNDVIFQEDSKFDNQCSPYEFRELYIGLCKSILKFEDWKLISKDRRKQSQQEYRNEWFQQTQQLKLDLKTFYSPEIYQNILNLVDFLYNSRNSVDIIFIDDKEEEEKEKEQNNKNKSEEKEIEEDKEEVIIINSQSLMNSSSSNQSSDIESNQIDFQIFLNLINQKLYRELSIIALQCYRLSNQFQLSPEEYLFNGQASQYQLENSFVRRLMMVGFSLYSIQTGGKKCKYLDQVFRTHRVWRALSFWESLLFCSIRDDLDRSLQSASSQRLTIEQKSVYFKNIVQSNLLTVGLNMFQFKLQQQEIQQLIIKYAKITEMEENQINETLLLIEEAKKNMDTFKESVRQSIKGVEDLETWKIIEIFSNHSGDDIQKGEIALDEQVQHTLKDSFFYDESNPHQDPLISIEITKNSENSNNNFEKSN